MKTNLLMIVLIILVLAGGYFGYNYLKPAGAAVVKTSEVTGSTPETRQLLDALLIMQNVRIDTGFFNSPLYKGLKDISPAVNAPAVKGRTNPFLPLE